MAAAAHTSATKTPWCVKKLVKRVLREARWLEVARGVAQPATSKGRHPDQRAVAHADDGAAV
jgi:hypothetical protein